jgi:HSP20 family protein
MSIFRWSGSFDPWLPLRQLQRELERWSGPQSRGIGGGAYPPINVYNSEDAVVVQCEMAGVDEKDLDVSITGDTLTIKGTKRIDEPDDARYIQRERGWGEFTRTVVLGESVDGDKISANLSGGVLTVRLPKSAAAKPRQIEVNAQ